MPYFFEQIDVTHLEKGVVNELHLLCSQLHEKVLSQEGAARLNELLDESVEARRIYLHHIALQSMLGSLTGKRKLLKSGLHEIQAHDDTPSGEFLTPGQLFQDVGAQDVGVSSGKSYTVRILTLAVAALLMIGAGVALWSLVGWKQNRIAETTPSRIPPINVSTFDSEANAAVASVSYVSTDVTGGELEDIQPGSALAAGKLFTLESGEVELTYASGTRLMLIGPTKYVVQETGGELLCGGLMASVTESGHGFTVETPNGKVVDLGTEFGVLVDDFGVSEVSVFQGKVEAFPGGKNIDRGKVELTKGRGLQWSESESLSLDADLRRFAGSTMRERVAASGLQPQKLIADDFAQQQIDDSLWKTLGESRFAAEGLHLIGTESGQKPYLITKNQFDPAQGTVIVSCDIRFLPSDSQQGEPTFSILARSADHRGTALPPWDDTLASCVRCSFGIDEDGDGIIHAGVKLEGDRELSETSWSSFLQPIPGETYRLVMRDDGINVSFTVSPRDNPDSAKTVRFRSLFRGKTNFIALEGPDHTSAIVDKVEILRDRSVIDLSDYASFSSLVQASGSQNFAEKQLLTRLIPPGAKLLLKDDFNQSRLNQKRWKRLGDVAVIDSAVQLGQPNLDSHIDSWKPRPYLLTRFPVDLKEGGIAVIGKITFSENFLAGYGASFATMTRANDRRGLGPGWENTILQKGIRLNFWPASWDKEHSLEIHEKASSNSLTLLATRGIEVDPQIHTYVFRIFDNGEEVELVVIDPLRPTEVQRITSRTHSTLREGFIGFESCWGSPVVLDDVAIYQVTD